MNRDFIRPLIIAILAVLFTGVLAWFIPEHQNHIFTIRKMPWLPGSNAHSAELDGIFGEIKSLKHTQKELLPFIKKLEALEPTHSKGFRSFDHNLRIAYFGDSIIEGDVITAPLRYFLQGQYGGKGVGFVPITSIVSDYRRTIKHDFSHNWESISFMTPRRSSTSLGISGYTFIPRPYYTTIQKVEIAVIDSTLSPTDSINTEAPADNKIMQNDVDLHKTETKEIRTYVNYDPWVEYRAVDIPGGATGFGKIRLFYSKASLNSTFTCSYDSGEPKSFRLNAGDGLQIIDISPLNPVKAIKLTFPANDPVHLYGVSFDEDEGVYIDNFAVRGYSGTDFQRIHYDLFAQFQKALGYDLVILQYGGNVTNPSVTSYNNYKIGMIRTISNIQEAMPDVPILIIGMHDRNIKIGSEYQTSPDIPLLIRAQSEMAAETGAGFFNLFEAMGGYNSMQGYVNQDPPLASKDYTHFTRHGGDKIALMLADFLFGKGLSETKSENR